MSSLANSEKSETHARKLRSTSLRTNNRQDHPPEVVESPSCNIEYRSVISVTGSNDSCSPSAKSSQNSEAVIEQSDFFTTSDRTQFLRSMHNSNLDSKSPIGSISSFHEFKRHRALSSENRYSSSEAGAEDKSIVKHNRHRSSSLRSGDTKNTEIPSDVAGRKSSARSKDDRKRQSIILSESEHIANDEHRQRPSIRANIELQPVAEPNADSSGIQESVQKNGMDDIEHIGLELNFTAFTSADGSEAKRDILFKRFADKITTSTATRSYVKSVRQSFRNRLIYLFRTFQLAYRLTMYSRNRIIQKLNLFKCNAATQSPSLSEEMRQKAAILDAKLLTTVKTLCTKCNSDLAALEELERILTWKIPDFGKFPDQERKAICKSMRYEAYDSGTVLLWEDHVVSCFYLVLSGQLEIFKLNPGSRIRLTVFNSGTVLGHARIKVQNATRSAGGVFLTPAVVLTIDRDVYMSIVEKIEKSLNPFLQRLETYQLFSNRLDFLKKVTNLFKVQSFQNGSVILEEKTRVDRIYWILSGKVSVSRIVPFIQLSGVTGLKAFQPGTVLKVDEKLIEYKLESNVLRESDWFPALQYNNCVFKFEEFSTSKKILMIDNYLVQGVICAATFQCLQTSIVCSAPIADFLSLCDLELLLELLGAPCCVDYPLASLQQAFLEQKRWATQKRHISEEFGIQS